MKKRSLFAMIALTLMFVLPTFAGNDAPKEKAKPDTPLPIVKTQDLSTYEVQPDTVIAEYQVVNAIFERGYIAVHVDSYSIATELSSPYTAEKPNGEKVGGIVIHNYVSLPNEQENNIKSKAPTLSELTADKTVLSVDVDN